jgi:hypothetical protein
MERRRPRRRSPLPYLILNVIISALTTLLVLWVWSRLQNNKLPAPLPLSAQESGTLETTTANEPTSLPPLPSLDSPSITILNVFGTGDIENEVVILQNSLEQEVWLDGWQLQDEDGNRYTFQALVLNHNAQIQLYTKAGFDTVTSLYWGRSEPVWQSGNTIKLVDYQGNTRSSFVIP